MKPAEYNRLIALRVMGWHEWNGDDDYDGPFPMFRIHGEAVWVYLENCSYVSFWFNPVNNERDCMRALDAAAEKMLFALYDHQFKRGFGGEQKKHTMTFWLSGERTGYGEGPTFCAAACDAMLKATEETDG